MLLILWHCSKPAKTVLICPFYFLKQSSWWFTCQAFLTLCCAKLLQSCPTLCNPMDHSLPDSFVRAIPQARIVECAAMLSSRGSSQPRNWTHCFLSLLHCQVGSLPPYDAYWCLFFFFFKEASKGFAYHHTSKRTKILIWALGVHNQYWYMKSIYCYVVNGFFGMYPVLQGEWPYEISLLL